MPAVVDQRRQRVELPSHYEWSWPDHPKDMTDADARMRVGRHMSETIAEKTKIPRDDVAVAYGRLLAEGKARIQETTSTGDNLPRTMHGSQLEVDQQMAIDVAERRAGLDAGAYTTTEERPMRESGPVPNEYGKREGFLGDGDAARGVPVGVGAPPAVRRKGRPSWTTASWHYTCRALNSRTMRYAPYATTTRR